jgi:hypothetical protein
MKPTDMHPLEIKRDGSGREYCEVMNCINSKCKNQNTRFFDAVDYRDRHSNIIFWEMMCPICGALWYIERKKSFDSPRSYKRI